MYNKIGRAYWLLLILTTLMYAVKLVLYVYHMFFLNRKVLNFDI